MITGIYQITNLHNGKSYVGSAVRFHSRWRLHKTQLAQGKHHSVVMQRAWNKYGEAAFEFKKLLVCAKADLIWFEQRAIDALKPAYNICKVAGSVLGYRHTDEAKAAASERATGNTHRRGRKESPEYCARISAGRKGKGLGRVFSAETKAKISAAHLGRTISEERKEHLRKLNTGKKQSAETIQKRMANSLKEVVKADGTVGKVHFQTGVPKSPELILKMRKALATLDEQTVLKVRGLLSQGLSCRSIRLELGISNSAVLKIKAGTSYEWVN